MEPALGLAGHDLVSTGPTCAGLGATGGKIPSRKRGAVISKAFGSALGALCRRAFVTYPLKVGVQMRMRRADAVLWQRVVLMMRHRQRDCCFDARHDDLVQLRRVHLFHLSICQHIDNSPWDVVRKCTFIQHQRVSSRRSSHWAKLYWDYPVRGEGCRQSKTSASHSSILPRNFTPASS